MRVNPATCTMGQVRVRVRQTLHKRDVNVVVIVWFFYELRTCAISRVS